MTIGTTGLIVARFTEPLDWLRDVRCEVTVYNKGPDVPEVPDVKCPVIPLCNVGRETHTYLYHIVHAYDSLDDYVIFAQGRPFDHCGEFIRQINDFAMAPKQGFHNFADIVLWNESTCALCKDHTWVPMARTYKALFGESAPNTPVCFGAGAQFAVSRDRILSRPKDFYERALAEIERDTPDDPTFAGYAFERLWGVIFQPPNS